MAKSEKLVMYSVFDRLTGLYSTPFLAVSDDVAFRTVADQLNFGMSEFRKHSDDLDLYKIGSFDIYTGELECQKEFIIHIKELRKEL